ncbi:MAG: hypothetical protein A2Z99_13355 [Treponema sp. GWB1_62_6]|nr:MAG: hypothetical protein A2Y36_18655 [Treponema sp. GWA1_62_8]OHE67630.1 MAG: hypothetical protein A2001_19775 [Treponema sp. GWC1_61_84]OHE69998.1 MAG: hypothetical protein A2Z99_13355 [Treponema sp. GWB1_62_6]OHE77144.1 MAG: hypothetical protein A2413_16085 [Treponema sp. RIFOXYC1_FULL_61_9]HCM25822.1 hypothetical protein [Treponema sp.]
MKRYALIGITTVMLIVGIAAACAQTPGFQGSSPEVEGYLNRIRSEQSLGGDDRINPDKVSKPLLAELGDAVMDLMFSTKAQHEFMDIMMGGEGSESLDSIHRWIAYRFLAGGYSPRGYGMMGMMGPGMMGMWGGSWGMMGNPDLPYSSIPFRSPEDVAKDRYANGEISREQYLQMIEDLKKTGNAGTR